MLLTAYFFSDLPLAQGPVRMTGGDFATNPSAVARFRERVDAADTVLSGNEAETQYVQERSAASANRAVASKAGLATGNVFVGELKSTWHRVYRFWNAGPSQSDRAARGRGTARVAAIRERSGILVTLAGLSLGIVILTAVERFADARARA